MVIKLKHSIRPANINDHKQLANLIHFGTLVHRHLDWRPPLEWIGHTPFLVLEEENRLVAALACPPDPPSVVWLRLFVAYDEKYLKTGWSQLWPAALEELPQNPDPLIAAIPLQSWFETLLKSSNFQPTTDVVMLIWDSGEIPSEHPCPDITIRPMNVDDLTKVEILDQSSFGSLWHNSRTSLEFAFNQAAIATVAEIDGSIVGYQISTAMQMGGHLARLATHPDYQRQGIGCSILRDLLIQFKQRGASRITVNTQEDNLASIALYENAGFTRTGETYPVYQYLPQ
ncbi:MAG: GNAT family N-acetyltransferase [Chloroflexota bacterium]|nr:MAG: GNAT family N-acetyltransferase [Chloroflexota bacterium]